MADFEIRNAVHIIKNFWVILASVQGTESTYQVQLLASARIVALQARSCAVTMPPAAAHWAKLANVIQ